MCLRENSRIDWLLLPRGDRHADTDDAGLCAAMTDGEMVKEPTPGDAGNCHTPTSPAAA